MIFTLAPWFYGGTLTSVSQVRGLEVIFAKLLLGFTTE
jgi:hypothetical protein